MRSDNKTERTVGCGVIAALDLLLYLCRHHSFERDPSVQSLPLNPDPVPQETYSLLLRKLRCQYLPLIPGHGINGVLLAVGLNRYFLKHRMPFHADWGVPYSQLWSRIERMLMEDIPVILSIGPNFPLFWQNNKLRLYQHKSDGSYVVGPQTHSHYITVTGMDEQWLQISSWGRQYYISRKEYMAYVREHSIRLVSNILYIRKKNHGNP